MVTRASLHMQMPAEYPSDQQTEKLPIKLRRGSKKAEGLWMCDAHGKASIYCPCQGKIDAWSKLS